MFGRIAYFWEGVCAQFYRVCCSGTISRSIWRRFAVFATVGFSALLLYLCLTEVQPAIEGLHFIQATCSINKTEIREYVPCNCGAYTMAACYPCLRVVVFLHVSRSDGSTDFQRGKEAYLYENLYLLRQKCFFQPPSCCDSKEDNKDAIEAKQKELHGHHGHHFLCYYSPHNSQEVILYRHCYELLIINSFVWPSVGITASILILRYLRRLRMEEEKDKIEILLKEAREYKTSDDDKTLEKPGLYLDEDVWILRNDDARS
ncbi:uncharacterized protein LOC116305493 [Actinia tenebrosa]|uniref:Uncharacterized protein LOC116305493 n=1 Tax=Actinia tenebrosa TaxID=6105 RepID=A0A6P8IZV9_ACTTE|nr:uncharacterized protein LOC116305493 [Actinia tenebrosa]